MSHHLTAHAGAPGHVPTVPGIYHHQHPHPAAAVHQGGAHAAISPPYAAEKGTSKNAHAPKYIIVEKTCSADCVDTECSHRPDTSHSNNHHARQSLSVIEEQQLRSSLYELFGLSDQSHPGDWRLFLRKKSVADLIASTAAQRELAAFLSFASGLPTILEQVARETGALDHRKIERYASCVLNTLRSLQGGEPAWLKDCVEPTTAVKHHPDARKIGHPDTEMMFVLLSLGHSMKQSEHLPSDMVEYARELMHRLRPHAEHGRCHASALNPQISSTQVGTRLLRPLLPNCGQVVLEHLNRILGKVTLAAECLLCICTMHIIEGVLYGYTPRHEQAYVFRLMRSIGTSNNG